MICRQFILEVEDFLASHPGTLPARLPAPLGQHAASCPRCAARWRTALRSRALLAGLGPELQPEPDISFPVRVTYRIEAHQARTAWEGRRGLAALRVARRDLAVAALLTVCTLGSFLYNFAHIERPSIGEAMVLDVPHLHPRDPALDHARLTRADAMINLLHR